MSSAVLVSIVIPAYKPQFFEKALWSAMRQDYAHLELVICDDCRDGAIAAIVERNRPSCRFPIRYFHNETPLLEHGNLARGIREARGEYVKFLYDDDLLVPTAVSKLLAVLQRHPGATLASAKRVLIDANDKPMGEIIVTIFPFKEDVLIDGQELVSFLGEHIYNFIGEPSQVLCRREDVLAFGNDLMKLNGEVMHFVGDLAIYVKLLRQGNLVMLSETLGCFRISSAQFSETARTQVAFAKAPYVRFRQVVQGLGWCRPSEMNSTVKVATLVEPDRFHDLNLADYFVSEGVLPMGNVNLQAWYNSAAKATPVKHWLTQRVVAPPQAQRVVDQRQALAGQVAVNVIVIDRHGDADALEVTFSSLSQWRSQTTGRLDWQVVNAQPGAERWVEQLNQRVRDSDSDWLLLLDAGDRLLPGGTLTLDLVLADIGDAPLVYFDELYPGKRDLNSAFRPDFNLDLLLSVPASMARHWLMQRQWVIEAGGFDADLSQALELDMILRILAHSGSHNVVHVAEPLLVGASPTVQVNPHELQGVVAHLRRSGYPDADIAVEDGRRYRIDYAHVSTPLVSIVVTLGRGGVSLERCLSGLLGTAYPFFEILIADCQALTPAVRQWLLDVQAVSEGKLRLLAVTEQVFGNAQINQVCQQAQGEFLVLFDEAVTAVRGDWLGELLNHGQRPEVALVASKLVTADGHVSQAGLTAGLQGIAGTAFKGAKLNDRGYLQRLVAVQRLSAASTACLLIRKSAYLVAGGLDEALQPGVCSDLDFCLKITRSGSSLVWTPYALLVEASRDAVACLEADRALVCARWGEVIAADPAYNRNLSLSVGAFALEPRVWLSWRALQWRPLPVVLACVNPVVDTLESRVAAPFTALYEAGAIDGAVSEQLLSFAEMRRFAPDSLVFQDDMGGPPLQAMREARLLPGVFTVLEIQAFLSASLASHRPDPMVRWEQLSQAAALADRVIVPTQALAEAFAPLHADVRVMQTRLGSPWLEIPARAFVTAERRPRIGCLVEPSTSLDFDWLATLISATRSRVDWVLWGDVPEALAALAAELPDASVQADPLALAALDLDLALAPLGSNGLDSCRSPLTLLQFGACGYCVICSDSPAYQQDLAVTRVVNTGELWLQAIEAHLSVLPAAHDQGARLRAQVQRDWMLDAQAISAWAQAWLR